MHEANASGRGKAVSSALEILLLSLFGRQIDDLTESDPA
jgi:hypothetical protein